ncbi:cytochrome P450 3A9-like [Centruroides sculpturatus]|uniref:cytochrome P450 3A9-like n=1 Tax=Centruroides sculpturatus TaxID=218467 RepID=UPI000C6D82CA|nr:cytochrome P450 3A9-like [Centruroides sculpturatus]
MVADPELLKNILIKDFHVFTEMRGLRFGDRFIDRMLFVQGGEKWKELRTIMSPTFTSGKLRMMNKLIHECTETLTENLEEAADNKMEIDVGKYFGAYAMDVITRCSFSMKVDSRKDPNNPLVTAVRKVVSPTSWRFMLAILFPDLVKLIRLSVFTPSIISFFENLSTQLINERKNLREDQKPKDFLQLLLDAESEDSSKKNGKKKLELEEVVAQCIMFFIVGYFTTAVTITFVAHQLAIKPEIQEKLLKEIDESLQNKKEIEYDDIAGLKYLDAVVQETLRYYTPSPRLERRSVEDYKLGDTGIVIPKSTIFAVPIYSLTHDPQYFPEPEKFDPER